MKTWSYRDIQKELKILGTRIARNQKRAILEQELNRLRNKQRQTQSPNKNNLRLQIYVKGKQDFKSRLEYVASKGYNFCRGEIGNNEWFQLIPDSNIDTCIFAYDENENVKGFVLLKTNYACKSKIGCRKQKENDSLYIEIVCGKDGAGGILINKVKELAREKHKKYVHLSSLWPVMSYYVLKHGFEVKLNCDVTQKNAQTLAKLTQELKKLSKLYHSKKTESEKLVVENEADKIMSMLKIHSYDALKHPRKKKSDISYMDGIYMTYCV